jgi:hypothetical protein
VEVPVYLGEQYVVKSSAFDSARKDYDYLGGSSRIDIATEHPTVVIVLGPKRFSDER